MPNPGGVVQSTSPESIFSPRGTHKAHELHYLRSFTWTFAFSRSFCFRRFRFAAFPLIPCHLQWFEKIQHYRNLLPELINSAQMLCFDALISEVEQLPFLCHFFCLKLFPGNSCPSEESCSQSCSPLYIGEQLGTSSESCSGTSGNNSEQLSFGSHFLVISFINQTCFLPLPPPP
jgi:hypothetical protein